MTSVTRTVVAVGAPATSIRTDLDLELIEDLSASLACDVEGHAVGNKIDGMGCEPSQPASWIGTLPCSCPPMFMCNSIVEAWRNTMVRAPRGSVVHCDNCEHDFPITGITFNLI